MLVFTNKSVRDCWSKVKLKISLTIIYILPIVLGIPGWRFWTVFWAGSVEKQSSSSFCNLR